MRIFTKNNSSTKQKLKIQGTNQNVLWSSSDDSIATVSEDGVVTGIDIGKTKITATIGKHKYNCVVDIPKPYFIYDSLNIGIGETEVNILLSKSDDGELSI